MDNIKEMRFYAKKRDTPVLGIGFGKLWFSTKDGKIELLTPGNKNVSKTYDAEKNITF